MARLLLLVIVASWDPHRIQLWLNVKQISFADVDESNTETQDDLTGLSERSKRSC